MPSSKRSWLCIGTIVALLLVAIPAQASPILPGQTVSPVEFPGGCACSGFLADTGSLPWFIAPFIQGTYRSAVYDRDPGAGVALEFLYQVTVSANSSQDVYRLDMSDFTGWATDVAYYDAGAGGFIAPSSAHRSASGSTIEFFLSILPNTTSHILAIRTNASTFASGNLLIVGGAVDRITVGAFQPSGTPPTPVPEPASLLLVGSGILAVRRRFARQ